MESNWCSESAMTPWICKIIWDKMKSYCTNIKKYDPLPNWLEGLELYASLPCMYGYVVEVLLTFIWNENINILYFNILISGVSNENKQISKQFLPIWTQDYWNLSFSSWMRVIWSNMYALYILYWNLYICSTLAIHWKVVISDLVQSLKCNVQGSPLYLPSPLSLAENRLIL